MPQTGSTFMDWQQLQGRSPLRIDDDFSWSEPPRRRRRPVSDEPIRARRRSATHGLAEESAGTSGGAQRVPLEIGDPAAFEAAQAEWFEERERFEPRRRPDRPRRARMFDLSDPGASASAGESRRTVVISGQGDGRYLPAPRRRRTEGLSFHERAGLRPDRAGMWAVLLGIALVIGAVAH